MLNQNRWKFHARHLALWTILCALFFAALLLGRAHLPTGDFSGQFHAFALFQTREIAQGRLPVWSPGSYAGFPFAADTQAGAFYPLRWLTILLTLPWEFTLYVLQLEAILHVWLAGLFTYGLAYSLTRARTAALLAAIALALGGYLTSFPLLQLAVLETFTWLPLALLFVHIASRREQPLRWLVATALILAVSLSAGHPQTFLHVAYVVALYYLFRTWQAGWSWKWVFGHGVLLAATAIIVAAVSWLPALRFALRSTRADVSYEFIAEGQPLLHYLQTFVPGMLATWSPSYLGVATLTLALLGWFGRDRAQDRPDQVLPGGRNELLFWALLSVLSAWLALGDEGLLFRLVYRIAPGFSLFRRQERLLGVTNLSMALAAAQGLTLWLRSSGSAQRRPLRLAALVLLLAFLAAGAFIVAMPQVDLRYSGGIWLRQMVLAALVLLLIGAARRRPAFAIALPLLLAADLYAVSVTSIDRQPGSPVAYWQKPAWLQTLVAEMEGEPARIDSRNVFHINLGEVYGLEDVHGISPLKPQFLDALETLPQSRRWQLLGVTHVIDYEPPEEAAQVVTEIHESLEPGRTVDAFLYRLPTPLPRAWLVYDVVEAATSEQALEIMAQPDFNPAQQVVLHSDIPVPAELSVPAREPRVEVVRLQANRLRISVNSEAPGLLVVSEWHYPGWRATVGGQPVELYPANYAFQAIPIGAGSHVVEMQFVPTDVILGALTSLVALTANLLLVWRWQPAIQHRTYALRPAAPKSVGMVLVRARHALERRLYWIAAHWRWLLLGMILGAFALRLFHLGVQELRGDEAFSFLYARRPILSILPVLIADGDPHPPLHYLLLAIWLRLTGDSEFAMRYLSATGGALLLPLLFRFGKRLRGTLAGLLLAAIIAISPSQIWLAQDVRNQYVLSLFFTILATLLLLRARSRPTRGGWFAYAVTTALAMYSHYYSLFALLAHGLYVLSGVSRRFLRQWLVAGTISFLFFVPWLLASRAGWRGQLSEPGSIELMPYLLAIGKELVAGPALAEGFNRWFVLSAFLLCGYGWVVLWRRRQPSAALLSGWLGLASLGIFLILLRRSTFNTFYIAVAAPAWWALLVVGLVGLWRQDGRFRAWGWLLSLGTCLVLLVISGISLYRYYGDPLVYGRSGGYRGMAEHVMSTAEGGDLFLAHFPDPSLVYYLRQASVPYEMQPATAGANAAETEARLAELATQYERLWFVPYHRSSWDPDDVAFRWLDYHLMLEEERPFHELTLQAYRPLHAADQILYPLQGEVNGLLGLEGVHMTVDGLAVRLDEGAVRAAPGATLNVNLVWQALAPIPENYTVFVHVLDGSGQLLAQHDGVPAHGTRPTTSWQPGERLLDEHRLQLSEAARGRVGKVVVGLYETANLERQHFDDGQETLVIGQIEVPP